MRYLQNRIGALQSMGVNRHLAAAMCEHRGQPGRIVCDARKQELTIYEPIGFDWWTEGGVLPEQLHQDLAAMRGPQITVRINSPGGDVFDGLTIYNLLKAHPALIDVQVDGTAASAASVVAMAGDTVHMNRGATMMVHRAHAGVMGNAADLRETANLLEKIDGRLADIYATRGTRDATQMLGYMDLETWFDGDEAVAAGLADTTEPTVQPGSVEAMTARRTRARARGRFAGN